MAAAVLIALALPALHMRLATSDASTYKKDDTSRIAYDLLKEGFGPGFNAPLLLAVELPQAGDQATLEKIGDALTVDREARGGDGGRTHRRQVVDLPRLLEALDVAD